MEVKPVIPAEDALAVQMNTGPNTLDVSTTWVVAPPEHIVCVSVVFVTLGLGFTLIVYVTGEPEHPLAVATME